MTAIGLVDLVIACSARDRLKYIEMGAKDAVFYPNIYPLKDFVPGAKDRLPSISIVSRGHWGSKAAIALLKKFSKHYRLLGRLSMFMLWGLNRNKFPKMCDCIIMSSFRVNWII